MNVSMLITSLREKKSQLIMIIHPSPSPRGFFVSMMIHNYPFLPPKTNISYPLFKGSTIWNPEIVSAETFLLDLRSF